MADVTGIRTANAGSTWNLSDAIVNPFQEYGSDSQDMIITGYMTW